MDFCTALNFIRQRHRPYYVASCTGQPTATLCNMPHGPACSGTPHYVRLFERASLG